MGSAAALLGGTLVVVVARPVGAVPVPWSAPVVVNTTTNDLMSVTVGDVDGDGDLDLASASNIDGTIAWYQNDGTPFGAGWTKTVVTTTASGAQAVIPADIDGDGDLDLASASFFDDAIAWYQNDGTPLGANWTKTVVTNTANGAQSVTAADIDGDGDTDLASASEIDDTIAWYRNDGTPLGANWTKTVVTNTANGAGSVTAADIDGDGDTDLASASANDSTIAWYENTAATGDGSTWTTTVVANTANGARSVTAADIDGDGRLDLASASFVDDTIAWYRNDGTPLGAGWTRTNATTTANGAQFVTAADIDGDGDSDLASTALVDGTIAWYENDGTPLGAGWTRTNVATNTTNAPLTVTAADIDGDGDADLATASQLDNTIAWHRNDSIHRRASAWTAADIATTASSAQSVAAGDLDGDGDPDLASASAADNTIAWYRNDGGGTWSTRPDITIAADGAQSVTTADLDGDGDLDLASASENDNAIAWYQNNGTGTFTTQPDIATTAAGAQSVTAADLDGDGDLDLASASFTDDTIAWYKNDGTGTFTTQADIATTADGARSVTAADLDGDGDLDLASASENDNAIAWYQNNGTGTFTTQPDIATTAAGAQSVTAADLDGDGDLDLASASETDSTIAWYENTAATGNGSTWTATDIATTANSARSVTAADLDDDGDLDLASASANDSTIAWYENDGATNPTFAATDLNNTASFAQSVIAADLDGDGDGDLASASQGDNTIAWYRNDGGQVAVATTATAPSSLASNMADDMLRLTVTNQGRTGDHAAELTGVALRLDDGTTALTQAQAQAIVDELRLYRDDGDNTFDFDDTLVTATSTLAVNGSGDLTLPIPDVTSAVINATASVAFHVVVDLKADAHLQTPNMLRVTHRSSSTTSEDDTFTLALTKAPASDVSSATMTATAPVATTTTTAPIPTPTTTTAPTTTTTLAPAPIEETPPPVTPASSGGSAPVFFVDGRPVRVPLPSSLGGRTPGAAVAISPTQSIAVTPDGRVFTTSPGLNFGGLTRTLAAPIVGIAVDWVLRDGQWQSSGYWLVGRDGGVFAFGTARFRGSLGGRNLAAPITGITTTPTRTGYWLVGRDGGVFTFGDARFFGSTGGRRLRAPIHSLAPTRTGRGYWLAAEDGGIFTFGDARFYGSAAPSGRRFNGVAAAPDGSYWLITGNGQVVQFTPK